MKKFVALLERKMTKNEWKNHDSFSELYTVYIQNQDNFFPIFTC